MAPIIEQRHEPQKVKNVEKPQLVEVNFKPILPEEPMVKEFDCFGNLICTRGRSKMRLAKFRRESLIKIEKLN